MYGVQCFELIVYGMIWCATCFADLICRSVERDWNVFEHIGSVHLEVVEVASRLVLGIWYFVVEIAWVARYTEIRMQAE